MSELLHFKAQFEDPPASKCIVPITLANMASLPELKYTPQHDIPGIVESARSAFNSQKTKPVEFRLRQLRKLYWGMRDNADAIASACKKDLGKGQFETNLTDIDMVLNDIIYTCNSLEKWMKDETAPDIPLFNKILRPKIRKDPLGCVLIIGYVLGLAIDQRY